MLKAYDSLLQLEIHANKAIYNIDYRYNCPCCGEDVILVKRRDTPYFKHRSGNNRIECENYLGNFGNANSGIIRESHSRADLYFNSTTKIFSLGLRFSESEIQACEEGSAVIEIIAGNAARPFYAVPINFVNFTPDGLNEIPLSEFAFSYSIRILKINFNMEYKFFNIGNIPTFFKVQQHENESKYIAKSIRSSVLYTGIKYVAILRGRNLSDSGKRFFNSLENCTSFNFDTMGERFKGFLITFENKTDYFQDILNSWGYLLEASEKFTLLWPPSKLNDEIHLFDSNEVFVQSSFAIQSSRNTNVPSDYISRLENNGLTKIFIESRTIIAEENIEFVAERCNMNFTKFDSLQLENYSEKIFTVPNKNRYYLFGNTGVTQLVDGQDVLLATNNMIIGFRGNYPFYYVYPHKEKMLEGHELLNDILVYCKRIEKIETDAFLDIELTNLAKEYIEKCEALGFINSVAKRYIEEGRI